MKLKKVYKLRDGRKVKIINITETRIWCKYEYGISAWNLDGKWRDDGIESCADIMFNDIQLNLNI